MMIVIGIASKRSLWRRMYKGWHTHWDQCNRFRHIAQILGLKQFWQQYWLYQLVKT